MTSSKSYVRQILGWACVAFVAAWGVKTFGFELFRVSSASMIPTLLVGDYVIVAKYPYGFTRENIPWRMSWSGVLASCAPKRGDIVVFQHSKSPSSPWIKRVVGLSGERICLNQGRLCLEGMVCPLLAQPFTTLYDEVLPGNIRYSVHRTKELGCVDEDHLNPVDIPKDAYFVLGDARNASQDSRDPAIGMIAHNQLLGRAQWVLFSQEPDESSQKGWLKRVRWDRIFKPLS